VAISSDGEPDAFVFVIGNKHDLRDERVVGTREGTKFLRDLSAHFCESSALLGSGLDELMRDIAAAFLERGEGVVTER
jgi:hypothetical protein